MLTIISTPINKLREDKRNARLHDRKNLDAIKGSLAKFGQQKPIVVDKDGNIIAGNGTYAAAKELGWAEIDVVQTDLEGDNIKAYALADNRSAELAIWNDGILGELLQELRENDFPIADIGFDPGDYGLQETREELTDPDEVPVVPQNVRGVQRGQIWQLGDHRMMCGDSTSKDDVARLMNGEKADCIFTDPPYNIAFKPQRGTHGTIVNDDMSPEKFIEFLRAVVACALSATKDTCYAFVWAGWPTLDQFAPVLREAFTIKALPIWVKNNFGIGYYSRPKYEPFFLCLRGEPKRPDVAPADVWEHAKVHETVHSCEKPVGLIEDILAPYVSKGTILDLFLGSGSTLIACEKTGRRCFGMEIDPHYCSVILERWEKFSGKQAKLLTS